MLGSLPPLRALSSYCLEFALAAADVADVEFMSFKRIYPSFLYPGGNLQDDDTFPGFSHPGLRVKRNLTWCNPFSWMIDGFSSTGDLLHAQWWSLPLWPVYFVICSIFRIRRKPVVFTVHNVHSHDKAPLFSFFSGLLFLLGNRFIVHSKRNEEQMIRFYGIDPGKIAVIPHGTLDFHVKKEGDTADAKAVLGISPASRTILMFGAVRPYKGVDTAIRAFAETLRRIPDSRLVIAGKLWESWEPYERIAEDLGVRDKMIVHTDYIPSGDVHRYFAAADLVILPYRRFDSQSGVGNVALSFRKPMIVSDVGGLPEFVEDRRYIVPPDDPPALAKAMADCLDNPDALRQMARYARQVSERFAWPKIVQETLAVYDSVLRDFSFRTGKK